jgi:hypothetical protein
MTGVNMRVRVTNRAEGECEAMIRLPNKNSLTVVRWVRCRDHGVEVHHMLPRSRGGLLLDAVKEDYHLIALCPVHHRIAHEWGDAAFDGALMILGYVVSGPDGCPCYTGPDEYLSRKYGGERVQSEEAAGDEPAGHATPRPLAGPARRRPAAAVGSGVGDRAARQAAANPDRYLFGLGHRAL